MSFTITKKEHDGLLYMYYQILYGLENYKGLSYKYCFNAYKGFKQAINDFDEKSCCIDDYILVKDDVSEV